MHISVKQHILHYINRMDFFKKKKLILMYFGKIDMVYKLIIVNSLVDKSNHIDQN